MQISVRSPIAIGVAAFTGAAAVAMTPSLATAPVPSLARITDAVTMAALANPLDVVSATAQLASSYLFATGYSPDPQANWPASGIGSTWNTLLQQTFDPAVGFLPGYTNVGLIPDLEQGGLPALTQFADNWRGYLSSGDLALISSSVLANGQAFLAAAQSLASEFAGNLGRQQAIVMTALNNAVSAVFAAFAAGGLGPAFDAALTGFLGPTGVAGTVLNLTIGAGIQTDAADPTTFVPSLRTEARTAGQRFAAALTTATPPVVTASGIQSAAADTAFDTTDKAAAVTLDKASAESAHEAPLKSAAAVSPKPADTTAAPSPAAAVTPEEATETPEKATAATEKAAASSPEKTTAATPQKSAAASADAPSGDAGAKAPSHRPGRQPAAAKKAAEG